jgi:ribosome-interacting GTPase 1
MPANLTPQYLEAEENYRQAKTVQDKLKCLQEMLAIIPKHKGTEKLQAQIKTRIAKLKQESQKKHATRREGDIYNIKREGAGQVVLVGLPNVGKSELVASITNASPEVADYPFTTRKPTPGMMEHENIQIQLIDMPPLTKEEYHESWIPQLIRNADALLMVIDLSEDSVPQMNTLCEILESFKVKPRMLGGLIEEEEELEFFEDKVSHKNTVMVGSKSDFELAEVSLEELRERYGDQFSLISISTRKEETLQSLKRKVFESLHIIRIYTKPPGKPADLTAPYIRPAGSTVEDIAGHVHKDFLEKLAFARLWRGDKFQGQRVQRDFVLEDGDVIELHI